MNIRRLPDLETIGKDLGDLFLSEDCEPNECIVRKGLLNNKNGKPTDCVMAFCKDLGILSIYVVIYKNNKWVFEKGFNKPLPIVKQAIESVINQKCPTY